MRVACLPPLNVSLIIIILGSVEPAFGQNQVPLGDPMPAQIDYNGEMRVPFPLGEVVETVTFTKQFVIPPLPIFGLVPLDIEFTSAAFCSFQLPSGCRHDAGALLRGDLPFTVRGSRFPDPDVSGAEPLGLALTAGQEGYEYPIIKCKSPDDPERDEVLAAFPLMGALMIGNPLSRLKIVDRFKINEPFGPANRFSALLSLACPVAEVGPVTS